MQVRANCCWTDIRYVEMKLHLCMVGHTTKMIRHQQNLNLTFTSVDLTNVRLL